MELSKLRSIGFQETSWLPDGLPAESSSSQYPGISCRQAQSLSPFLEQHQHHYRHHDHHHHQQQQQQQQQQMLSDGAISLPHCVCGPPPNSVARRNERERNRVRFINHNFVRLREHLPCPDRKKKLSKVETLRTAVRYIQHLKHILREQEKDQEAALSSASDFGTDASEERCRIRSDSRLEEAVADRDLSADAAFGCLTEASLVSDENSCSSSSSSAEEGECSCGEGLLTTL